MDGIAVGGGDYRGRFSRSLARPRYDEDEDSQAAPHHRTVSQPPRVPEPRQPQTVQPPPPRRPPAKQLRTPTPEDDDNDADAAAAATRQPLPATPAAHGANPTPPPTDPRRRKRDTQPPAPPQGCTIHASRLPPLRHLSPLDLAEIARRAHDGEAWLTIQHVGPDDYDAYCLRFPDEEDGGRHQPRVEYDAVTRELMVRCMASPVHDVVGEFFTHTFVRAAHAPTACPELRTLRAGIRGERRMCEYKGFTNVPGLSRVASKIPDFSIRGSARFPAVILEVGWTESLAKLIADANLFLTGSAGATRIAILVQLTEHFPATYTLDDATTITHSHAVTTLKHQCPPPGYRGARTADALAEFYLERRLDLVPPLMGRVDGVALVYMRSAHDGATVTPVSAMDTLPRPDNVFPAISLVHEIPFLAEGRPLPAIYNLPVAHLLDQASSPATDADIPFNLETLAASIIQEFPAMEWHRALTRAEYTLRPERKQTTLANRPSRIPLPVASLEAHNVALGRGAKRASRGTRSRDAGGEAEGDADGDDDGDDHLGTTAWKRMRVGGSREEREDSIAPASDAHSETEEGDDGDDGEYTDGPRLSVSRGKKRKASKGSQKRKGRK
ncbi:hypothetical protein DFH27DRAFT_218581 [Peziza echinospora]|nr:hypothetical protein DFH27DRAFT_218581 [Peziza echinospora]